MRQAGAGCQDSVAELYRLTSGQVWGLGMRFNGDCAKVEDGVLDACLSAWRRAARFDPGKGDVVAWLLTIARHRAIDRLRHGVHRSPLQGHIALQNDAQDFWASAPCPGPGPLRLQAHKSDTRSLANRLTSLPAMRRKSLVPSFYEGLSDPEIAVRPSQPLGSVKSWAQRAWTTLKTGLAAA